MNEFVKLAGKAIGEYTKTGKIIPIPKNLPPDFYEKKRGVFVTIRKNKELRGCIGTYLPERKNLAEEIILNAVAACSRDHRFSPIQETELPELSIEVSLLGTPEKISDTRDLDPKKYGVIVKCSNGRCGLLLPDLKGISSAEEQFSVACQKGGINPMIDKAVDIYKFTVDKYD